MIGRIIGSTIASTRARTRARWPLLALAPALTAMAVSVPQLRSLSPSYVTVGAGAVQVKLHGEGFTATTVARLGAETRPTRVINDKLVQLDLTAADVATARTVSISVATPGTSGGVSNALPFEIREVVEPSPIAARITAITPAAAPIGSAPLRLSVSGTGFGTGGVVRWNAQPLVTRVLSATVLEADVAAALMATAAAVRLVVVKGDGTASNAIPFAVAELPPSISSVSPTTLTLLQGVNFVVRGRNFTPATRFRWGGSEFEPTMVSVQSATEIIADLRGGYLGQPGTENVTVATRYPSGTTQVSNSVAVTIVLPPGPTITSLAPSSVAAGTNTGLRIRGTNFTSTSEVRLDGTALSPQTIEFLSATELGLYLGGAYFIDRKSIAVTVANKLATGHVLVSPAAMIQVTP